MKKTKTQNIIIKKIKKRIQNITKNSNCILQYNCSSYVLYSMRPTVLHSEHS